ncbi:MAG: 5-oxoprolinase subunit PxpB [Janthinobacterium lividum]
MNLPKFCMLGEAAVVLECPPPARLAVQTRIWSVARAAKRWPHVTEVVPGMNNLTVLFDPIATTGDAIAERLASAWQSDATLDPSSAAGATARTKASARPRAASRGAASQADAEAPAQAGFGVEAVRGPLNGGRSVEIEVVYGGAAGPDLEAVARGAQLSPEEVIQRHTAAEYLVFFVGFLPGFAYLGGLDSRLATARRDTPRLQVPAGSVGIGGTQTGIYPQASPGGWHLIGRTARTLFDPTAKTPALLAPGDRVRLVAVSGS